MKEDGEEEKIGRRKMEEWEERLPKLMVNGGEGAERKGSKGGFPETNFIENLIKNCKGGWRGGQTSLGAKKFNGNNPRMQ